MMLGMRWTSRGQILRGAALAVFGRTAERRMEREVVAAYEARVRELLPQLSVGNLQKGLANLAVPQTMRGYGHVKLANVLLARVREAELLYRLDPQRYPQPVREVKAGQLRGIPVTAQH